MTAGNPVNVRAAVALVQLRNEFDGWWIHRSDSGRWLAIRENTCIRATGPGQLRERLRNYLSESANETGGDES